MTKYVKSVNIFSNSNIFCEANNSISLSDPNEIPRERFFALLKKSLISLVLINCKFSERIDIKYWLRIKFFPINNRNQIVKVGIHIYKKVK